MIGEASKKYVQGGSLISSAGKRWRGLSADLRFHPAGERPANSLSATEIAVMVKGTAIVSRQSGGVRQRVLVMRGTIGLTPAGLQEDFKLVENDIQQLLHIHLSSDVFKALNQYAPGKLDAANLRYAAGFEDPLVERIALEILSELQFETSYSDLLIATLTDALAVLLLSKYSDIGAIELREANTPIGLDPRRLQRVMDYIEANLENEITIEGLATVAALSRFHFSRMFKATTGYSPSSYIGKRRLELAKARLLAGFSISQIAFDCRFSSESNFTRSFRRATGLTPGQFRDRTRVSKTIY